MLDEGMYSSPEYQGLCQNLFIFFFFEGVLVGVKGALALVATIRGQLFIRFEKKNGGGRKEGHYENLERRKFPYRTHPIVCGFWCSCNIDAVNNSSTCLSRKASCYEI